MLVVIADLASRIFGDLLPHTPIGQLGINRSVHFNAGTQTERNRIGRLLAPLEPWGSWGAEMIDTETVESNCGLRALTIIQQGRKDRKFGHIQTTVEPSLIISQGRTGIYMS